MTGIWSISKLRKAKGLKRVGTDKRDQMDDACRRFYRFGQHGGPRKCSRNNPQQFAGGGPGHRLPGQGGGCRLVLNLRHVDCGSNEVLWAERLWAARTRRPGELHWRQHQRTGRQIESSAAGNGLHCLGTAFAAKNWGVFWFCI